MSRLEIHNLLSERLIGSSNIFVDAWFGSEKLVGVCMDVVGLVVSWRDLLDPQNCWNYTT